MINTIFNVISALRTALLPIGLTIYKEIKPETELGNCLVLNYMPISKTNVNSVNDVVIFFYAKKISGMADSATITTVCNSISAALKDFDASNGVIFFNEQQEPVTDNVDTNYTATRYIFRTINS